MNYYKRVAYELCKEMGIEWDETATVPTVSGADACGDNFSILFPETLDIDSEKPLRVFEASEKIPMIPFKSRITLPQNGVRNFVNGRTIALCA